MSTELAPRDAAERGASSAHRHPRPSRAAPLGLARLVPAPLLLGAAAYVVGLSQVHTSNVGAYGLLASSNVWFVLSFPVLAGGLLLELRRPRPRTLVLLLYLGALVVAIHAAVPILYGTPEYDWLYKHIGITEAFQHYGHVTDPSNIYQRWPAFFAGAAALSGLGHISSLTYSTWAPLAFQLANALVLLGCFRVLVEDRRVVWISLLLYEGLVSWVGQDYFSPQAFTYLLWLGMVVVMLRWLRTPRPQLAGRRFARLRASLVAGLPVVAEPAPGMRVVAVVLVSLIYVVTVAAHQLTPYVALAAVAAFTLLDLLRPKWLFLLLLAIAIAYLAPRYGLISRNFGGLFSGFNLIENASGSSGTDHPGAEATTALIIRSLAGVMWLATLAAVFARRKAPGRVVVPATLAFSPFVVLLAQRYGGEAIYRVFLFSAPWCALIIVQALARIRVLRWRWLAVTVACGVALFAGLQGLYSPTRVDSFSHAELAASRWLYANIPSHSAIVLPVENFPNLESPDYNLYPVDVMPADPQRGLVTLDEGNLVSVERWMVDRGHAIAYVPVSRSMYLYWQYFGWPRGYVQLLHTVASAPGWTAIYRNADVTIYRVDLSQTTPTTPPVFRAPAHRKHPRHAAARRRPNHRRRGAARTVRHQPSTVAP